MPKVKRTPDQIREQARQSVNKFRLAHPEIIKERKRKAYIKLKETRPDKIKELNEQRKEWHRQWVALHPEEAKELNRQTHLRRRQKHPEMGTRENPNLTGEKWINNLKNLTFRFPKGHHINKGKPSKLRGRKKDPEIVEKAAAKQRGRKKGPASEEIRRKMSEAQRKRHEGKDRTVARENRFIREGIEIKLWREAIFRRDDWTCVHCGKRGAALHADHIKPFAYFPELRLELSNGRTLCVPCHKKTDTYMGRARARYEFKKTPTVDTARPSQVSEALS